MKYSKPTATSQRLSGLMGKRSGVCCIDIRCPECA